MANYIFVDEEFDVVRVYDNDDVIDHKVFDAEEKTDRRAQAEAYAKQQAAKLQCDWGTNYGE